MKKLLLTSIIALAAILVFPGTASAAGLNVTFETGAPPTPLFNEANFLPGDAVTRWAEVENVSGADQQIAAEVFNFSDPDGLADQLMVSIRRADDSVVYATTTLTVFYGAGEIVLDTLSDGSSETYYFTVMFEPSAGNPYQTKTTQFDFRIGIFGDEGGCDGDCGDGTITTFTTGGGGSSNPNTGSISGTKFHDLSNDGIFDVGEPVLSGWIIYIDANGNDVMDIGETTVVTDVNGNYTFNLLAPGSYTVREVLQPGWEQTYPVGGEHVVAVNNSAVFGIYFGNLDVGTVAGITSGEPPQRPDSGEVKGEQLPKTGADVMAIAGLILFSWIPALRRKQD